MVMAVAAASAAAFFMVVAVAAASAAAFFMVMAVAAASAAAFFMVMTVAAASAAASFMVVAMAAASAAADFYAHRRKENLFFNGFKTDGIKKILADLRRKNDEAVICRHDFNASANERMYCGNHYIAVAGNVKNFFFGWVYSPECAVVGHEDVADADCSVLLDSNVDESFARLNLRWKGGTFYAVEYDALCLFNDGAGNGGVSRQMLGQSSHFQYPHRPILRWRNAKTGLQFCDVSRSAITDALREN